jgi:hypothetical protein
MGNHSVLHPFKRSGSARLRAESSEADAPGEGKSMKDQYFNAALVLVWLLMFCVTYNILREKKEPLLWKIFVMSTTFLLLLVTLWRMMTHV